MAGINGPLTDPKVTATASQDGIVAYNIGNAADNTFPVTVTGKTAGTVTLTVTYSGNSNYASVSKTVTVTVMPVLSLEDSTLTLTYGESKKLEPTVTASGSSTLTNVSYTYTIKSGSDVVSAGPDGTVTALKVGTAEITVTASADGYISDTKTVTVKVDPKTLTDETVQLNPATAIYTGAEQKLSVEVKDGEKTLKPDTDYSVAYGDGDYVNAGDYTVTVTGKGNYTGTVEKTFTIGKAKTEITIEPSSASILVNGEATFNVGVKDTDHNTNITLTADAIEVGTTPDVECTVGAAADNKLPVTVKVGNTTGDVTLTVTYPGNDNYTSAEGTATVTVSTKPVLNLEIGSTLALKYGESETLKPTASSSDNSKTPTVAYAITSGGEFVSVTEGGTVEALKAGEAEITVTASADGFDSVTRTVAVTVNPADCTFTVPDSIQTTVTVGAAMPTENKTFTASGVGDEKVPGTLTWFTDPARTQEASGNFNTAGEVTLYWTFTPGNENYNPDQDSVTFTVQTKTPLTVTVDDMSVEVDGDETADPVVEAGGTPLTPGDYTIAYSSSDTKVATVDENGAVTGNNVGSVTVNVSVEPKGIYAADYRGSTTTFTVTVTAREVTPGVSVSGTFTYNGRPQTPDPTVEVDGKTLTKDVDYTLSYEDNTDAGIATVTVTAVDGRNYTWDAVNETFEIRKADLTGEDASIKVKAGNTATQTVSAADFGISVSGRFSLTGGESIEGDGLADGSPTFSADIQLTLEADAEAGTITIPVTFTPEKNYNSVDLTLTVEITDKDIPEVGSIGTYTKTYDSNKVATGDLELTAQVNGEDVLGKWTFVSDAPVNAGTYSCILEFTPDDESYESVRTTVDIEIEQATITIKAKDMSLVVGSTLPTIPTESDYTVTGLLRGDTLSPVPTAFRFSIGDTSTATNSATVTVTGDEFTSDGNYTIVYEPGKLTVTEDAPVIETVARPTANPRGGTFTDSQTVTLSCRTPGADIYYTTDGTKPTTASARYTGPITIYNSATIRAVAVKDGMEDSAVLTVTYTKNEPVTPPAQPDYPIVPDYPFIPDYPDAPSSPANPGTSSKPNEPVNPAEPENPDIPSTPEAPDVMPNLPVPSFTDLNSGAWYQDAIEFVVQNGLMSGYGDGTFSPDSNLTRAQLAQILYNKEGNPAVTGGSIFADVPDGQWYTPAIVWAAAAGVVGGYGDGLFGPNNNITREQLVVMLWRYAGAPAAGSVILNFRDADQASDWAVEALKWAVSNGILNGKGDGILDPTGFATRAEAAQMLKNFIMIP